MRTGEGLEARGGECMAQAFLEDNNTDGMIPVEVEVKQHGEKVRIRIHRKGVSMTLLFDADLLECIDSDDRR